jgi:hypothetical protein
MNMIERVLRVMIAAGFIFSLVTCTNTQTKDKNNQQGNDSGYNEMTSDDEEAVFYLLPSPGEILLRFYTADIEYQPEHLNSPDNRDKYIGSKAQSQNLGVYITDMAYSALFERSTETVSYLEAIQSMSSELGISSNIFESLLTRSKANAGQLDSLLNISNEAFTNMIEFLETGGKELTIAQVSAGAYIESLNIALNSVDKYEEGNEMIELLLEMKFPMDNLLEQAKAASETEKDKAILIYLNEISLLFNELDNKGAETSVTQTQPGVVTIKGGDEITMNETNFNTLKEKVSEIRKNIVNF